MFGIKKITGKLGLALNILLKILLKGKELDLFDRSGNPVNSIKDLNDHVGKNTLGGPK